MGFPFRKKNGNELFVDENTTTPRIPVKPKVSTKLAAPLKAQAEPKPELPVKPPAEPKPVVPARPKTKPDRFSRIAWAVTLLIIGAIGFLLLQRNPPGNAAETSSDVSNIPASNGNTVSMPYYTPEAGLTSLVREIQPHTTMPEKPRTTAEEYVAQKGDSVFSIAKRFNLRPESVLWANHDTLQDDPQSLSVGVKLIIPPTDGIYYKWKEGDDLQRVAEKYKVELKDIVTWPYNRLDITNPVIDPGSYVMVPGGQGEYRQWLVPVIPRGKAGVTKKILGPGACETGSGGAVGTGSFAWPTQIRGISGNDYWGGHLGIDVSALEGNYIFATDSGVVVYAGPIGGGYGIMVMIDHGNGYQSLYAHLSAVKVGCGQSVSQGQVIGLAGSTGNSTGPHLHFEVRYNGGWINPHTVVQ